MGPSHEWHKSSHGVDRTSISITLIPCSTFFLLLQMLSLFVVCMYVFLISMYYTYTCCICENLM